MRLPIALLLLSLSPAWSQSCPERSATFDKFLRKYNPYTKEGPRASIKTVQDELGKPTSIRQDTTGLAMLYDYPECQGRVLIDSDGVMFSTSVVNGKRYTGNDKRQLKLDEIDKKITNLEAQLAGLRALRQAIQEMPVTSESEFVPEGSAPTMSPASVAAPSNAVPPQTRTVRPAAATSSSSPVPSAVIDPLAEPKPADSDSGTTASGQTIYTGPRGGKYHYSPSGQKVYQRKK